MAGLGDALRERLKAWTFELGGPGTRARLETLTPPRNEYGVDPYGLDVDFVVSAMAPLLWLYKRYFRVELHGADRVPNEGRVIIVSNHSGQLPFDAAMLEVGLLVDKDPPRVARALVERWVPTLPFVSTFMARCGQIVGTPENCRRLLAADEAACAASTSSTAIATTSRGSGSGSCGSRSSPARPSCPARSSGPRSRLPRSPI